jgi:hypothetical protein
VPVAAGGARGIVRAVLAAGGGGGAGRGERGPLGRNSGSDVLGLGYMGLFGSNIFMGSLVRVPLTLSNPRVEFHTLTLACG